MATVLTLQYDEEQRRKLREFLSPKQYRAAMYQATLRTTRKVAKLVRAQVKKRSYITKKYVDRVVTIREPRSDDAGNAVGGEVRVKHEPLPLIAFRVRVSKKAGVTVYKGPGQAPVTFRHGFKALVRTKGTTDKHEGHEGIFLRARHLPTKGPNVGKGKLTPQGFAGRFAIEEVFGPSVFKVVNVPQAIDEIVFDARAELAKQIGSQIDRFTKPKVAPAPAAAATP